VWRFIHDLSFLHDFAQEPVAVVRSQTTLNLLWRPYDQVEHKRPFKRSDNSERRRTNVTRRHDDEQIDVAFLVRRAVGVGAEQNDSLRLKFLRDPTCEALDRR
jgi:hypothetical protein